MRTWITADWHLGDDRFQLMQRPFASRDGMVETLIANHNRLVAPDDLVIVAGDVCYQNTPEFISHIARFNGRKILVRGNHDRIFSDRDLAPYFEKIYPEGGGFDLNVQGLDCYVTHYPSTGKVERLNLVGHIHSAWKVQLNAINVGVDVNHFLPVNLDEQIPFLFKAISEFYDADVWTAYSLNNAHYLDRRGKKTSYLDNDHNTRVEK